MRKKTTIKTLNKFNRAKLDYIIQASKAIYNLAQELKNIEQEEVIHEEITEAVPLDEYKEVNQVNTGKKYITEEEQEGVLKEHLGDDLYKQYISDQNYGKVG